LTHTERFTEACASASFAHHQPSHGLIAWQVRRVLNGESIVIDGPFITEHEAMISADLLRGSFRGARPSQNIYHVDAAQRQGLQDLAMAARCLLARQLGVYPTTEERP